MDEDKLKELRLQATIGLYKSLREEILQKFRHHITVYSIFIPTMTLVAGFALKEAKYDLILLLPIISLPFMFRYIWEQKWIDSIGKFLRYMEEEIFPKILGDFPGADEKQKGKDENKYWVGWELRFEGEYRAQKWEAYYKWTTLAIFVLFPLLPAMLVNVLSIIKSIPTQIPPGIHYAYGALFLTIHVILGITIYKT